MDTLERKKLAVEMRKDVITETYHAKSGHPGGSLSAVEIVEYLYFEEMRIDPKNPKWEDRDRFVLSKGHVAPIYYSALARKGFFPVEDLVTLRKPDSYLQGHRRVLIITGKGIKSEDEPWYEAKGVLREALPAWLNSPNIRPFILSICPAGRDEGGSGAMSILLKRQRDPKSIRKRTR